MWPWVHLQQLTSVGIPKTHWEEEGGSKSLRHETVYPPPWFDSDRLWWVSFFSRLNRYIPMICICICALSPVWRLDSPRYFQQNLEHWETPDRTFATCRGCSWHPIPLSPCQWGLFPDRTTDGKDAGAFPSLGCQPLSSRFLVAHHTLCSKNESFTYLVRLVQCSHKIAYVP